MPPDSPPPAPPPAPAHALIHLEDASGPRGAFECHLSPRPSAAWMAMFLEPFRVLGGAMGMRVWLDERDQQTPSVSCNPEDHDRAVEVVQWCVDSANRAYATLSLPGR